jgi:BioD-like phosphotransacetylase family protein
MTLNEIRAILGAEMLSRGNDDDIIVKRVYCADLMSNVLSYSIPSSLLVTNLTNAQVVRTADVADIEAIVFCRGKRPDPDTIALAERKVIPLLVTGLSMFDTCGRLYEKGLRSDSEVGP